MGEGQESNTRVIITTAVISAVSTIVIALIGVLPQLRQQRKEVLREDAIQTRDQALQALEERLLTLDNELEGTRQRNDTLAEQFQELSGATVVALENWRLFGRIRTADGEAERPLGGAEVFLIPAHLWGDLVTAADDSGEFVFERIPSGAYHMIVYNSDTKVSHRGLIQMMEALEDQTKELQPVVVTYSVHEDN